MSHFREAERERQIKWRRKTLQNQENGRQNNHYYEHVLPAENWELNLWPGIRSDSSLPLSEYLKREQIQKHSGSHNLLSSWILCANLYFPFRKSAASLALLRDFLSAKVSADIAKVTCVELEFESRELCLKHGCLLGEKAGKRGSGQTSPDLAFIAESTNGGQALILVESKFTESNFERCSGYFKKGNEKYPRNSDPSRCLHAHKLLPFDDGCCHLGQWGRRYWEYLLPAINKDAFAALNSCPAAFAGYQLLRQQALTEAIAQSGRYELVMSCVAYDRDNDPLLCCLTKTGISDFRTGWGRLFSGKSKFLTFTHQEWVSWIRQHDDAGEWQDWLIYIEGRYGY